MSDGGFGWLVVALWLLPLPVLGIDIERRRRRIRLLQMAVQFSLAVVEVLRGHFPGEGFFAALRAGLVVAVAFVLAESFLAGRRRSLPLRIAFVGAALLALGLGCFPGRGMVHASEVLASFCLACTALLARSLWIGLPVAAAAFCLAGGRELPLLQILGEVAFAFALVWDVRARLRELKLQEQRFREESRRRGTLLQALSSETPGKGGLAEDRLETLLYFARTSIRADGGAIFHYREEETEHGTLSRKLVCAGGQGRLAGVSSRERSRILAQLLLSRLQASGERVMECRAEQRIEALVLEEWGVARLVAALIRVQGRPVGVLALSLPEEGKLGPEDMGLLDFLSQQAAFSLYHDQVYNLMVEQTRLVREFDIAARLQKGLLPEAGILVRNLDVQASMQAAREVGGDYYDVIPIFGDQAMIVIGDVAGKGLPAGMIMLIVRTILHVLLDLRPEISPSWVNEYLNARLGTQLDLMSYVTFLCLRWNPSDRTFLWSGAGHEHILLWKAEEEAVHRFRSGGMALGLWREPGGVWKEHELRTVPGDALLLYTDGVTEARGEANEAFGLERLEASFARHARLSAAEILAALRSDLERHVGKRPSEDDQTIFVMKVS